MARGLSVVLGIGLIVLGLLGGHDPNMPEGFTWVDFGVGLASIFFGAVFHPKVGSRVRAGWPFFFAGCLLATWLIRLVYGAGDWMAWWNFAFACAYVIAGLSAFARFHSPAEDMGGTHPPETEEERERRVG